MSDPTAITHRGRLQRWTALFAPSEGMPRDRSLHTRGRGYTMLAGAGVVGLCWGLGLSSGLTESLYARGLGQIIGRALAAMSGWIPTSLAEAVIVLAGGWWLFHALRAGWYVQRRRRGLLNAVGGGAMSFGAFAAVALALFYFLWGVNYLRPSLVEREQWQTHSHDLESPNKRTDEVAVLCAHLIEATNREYVQAMGSADSGAPSMPRTEMAALDADLELAYQRLQVDLELEQGFGASRAPAKPVAASALMDCLHIGGFYFPWTGEANYNRLQPACVLPHVIAHEKAHQRCVTSEDEADFLGFAACVRADDPYVRYSGYLFAQRRLLSELAQLDAERALDLVKRRHPGVQRDVDDLRRYWKRLEKGVSGMMGQASSAVNDAYLKANRVEGGVKSYRMSSKLLIVYARMQGGVVYRAQKP